MLLPAVAFAKAGHIAAKVKKLVEVCGLIFQACCPAARFFPVAGFGGILLMIFGCNL